MATKISQLIISSLVAGSVLALVAFGYNLVYSTTRIINFAQSGTVVLGGYLVWKVCGMTGPCGADADPGARLWLAVLVSVGLSAVIGVVVWAVTILPLGRFDPMTNIGWVLTTFSAYIVIQASVARFISSEPQPLPPLLRSLFGLRDTTIFGASFNPSRALIIVGTLLLMGSLELMYTRTMIGRAFRAVAEERMAASLMGVNGNFVIALSFALAGMTGSFGAALFAPIQGLNFQTALLLGIEGFVAAVMGGLGSTKGAILGGYSIAFLKTVLITVFPRAGSYEQLVVLGLFIAVLLIKPTGFFGEPAVEKV
ncbi:MAG: hypothetical protein C4318_02295 [Acidimicrobiia bacterium]